MPMTLLSTRKTLNIGTWNVRTMYEAGKSAHVAAKCGEITSPYSKTDGPSHETTGLDMEPSGQAKEGETEKHLAA